MRSSALPQAGKPNPIRLPEKDHSAPAGFLYRNPEEPFRRPFPFYSAHPEYFDPALPEKLRPITLRDLLVDWGDAYWMAGYSLRAILKFCRTADCYILPLIGDIHLDQLHTKHIHLVREEYRKVRPEDRFISYTISTVLGSFFHFALRMHATKNPTLIQFADKMRRRSFWASETPPSSRDIEIPFRFPSPEPGGENE